MKHLIIAVIVLALAIPAYAMLGSGDFVFETEKKGTVVFPHRDHQQAFQCFVCHHMSTEVTTNQSFKARAVQSTEERTVRPCRACHGTIEGIREFKSVAHAMCKDCHKKLGGPTKCGDCHK